MENRNIMKNKFIPLASPDIREDDIASVVSVLKSGMLVQGEKVLSLEKNIGTWLGAEHVVALSNGTATMHLALIDAGIKAGDEVIVPAFSYVATANVVELVGATPVFVDIEIDTFNIDIEKIEAAITTRTKAIIPVHEFGLACDMAKLIPIAEKHNLVVIEDAACALGAKQNDKFTGTFGDYGSFSLHPRKAISSGEGGLLLVKNSKKSNNIRSLRNHGIEMKDGQMDFVIPGYNYRMTDIQAALVDSQLKRIENTLEYKNELANIYFDEVKNSKLVLPSVPIDRVHTWQTFHVLLPTNELRNQAIIALRNDDIGTNYGAQCIPAQTYYKNKYKLDVQKLYPNAYKAYSCGLAIPLYEKLTKENISYIAKHLNKL